MLSPRYGFVFLGLVAIMTATLAFADEPQADTARLFEDLDADGDGKIHADELQPSHEALFRRLLRVADSDGDGALDETEWNKGLKPQKTERPLEKLPPEVKPDQQPAAVFARLDKNQDGRLTQQEIPAQGREMWVRFVQQSDRDGDGALNRVEFMRNFYRISRFLNQGPDQVPRFAAGILERLDSNQDRKLQWSEIPEERREQSEPLFALADRDADGALDQRELIAGLQAQRQQMAKGVVGKMPASAKPVQADPREKEVAELLRRAYQLDKNGDAEVDEDEARGPLAKHFERIDADGSGTLDRQELTRAAETFVRLRQQAP